MGDLQERINEILRKALRFETLEEFEEYGIRLGRHTELIERLREDWGRAVELLEIEDWDQFCRRHWLERYLR